uniref:Uncharacterized protein n=1 Tax=Kalanchoe fedtschenkoi TaxID=63787 RepID=A0A7N0ZZI0_KALFE
MWGITSARDTALAVEAGADFIGMILCPNSKRPVWLCMARKVSKAAKEYGAERVGVFVVDDAETMLRDSEAADVELGQVRFYLMKLLCQS